MSVERFVREREPAWTELESRMAAIGGVRTLASLPGSDIRRLAALHRQASNDLAVARTIGAPDAIVRRLNRLCTAAHGVVYSKGTERRSARALSFLRDDVPRAVRETLPWHLAALGAFLVGAVAAYLLVRANPDLAERELLGTLRQRADRAAAQPEGAQRYLEVRSVFRPFLAWGVMANNIGVGLLAFGLGGTTVILAAVIALVNGIMLGSTFAAFAERGVDGSLAEFAVAHGPIEMTAIFLSAGAGMSVGWSWIAPGRRQRSASLADGAARGLRVFLGAVVLLVVAGLIEGFLSPSGASPLVKCAVGAGTFAAMILWFALGGRVREPAAP